MCCNGHNTNNNNDTIPKLERKKGVLSHKKEQKKCKRGKLQNIPHFFVVRCDEPSLLLPVQQMPTGKPRGLASFVEIVDTHAASAVGLVQHVCFGHNDVRQTRKRIHLCGMRELKGEKKTSSEKNSD